MSDAPIIGKKRTRQHVLADLAVNHVERVCLRAGYSVQRMASDYGIDLLVTTYTTDGFVEPGWLSVQVKASESLMWSTRGAFFTFPLDVRDVNFWSRQIYPTLLIVYEGNSDRAHWLHVQPYMEGLKRELMRFVNVKIEKRCRFDLRTVRRFATMKRGMELRRFEVFRYEE